MVCNPEERLYPASRCSAIRNQVITEATYFFLGVDEANHVCRYQFNLPTLTRTMGFTGYEAQLMSAPPYIAGGSFILANAQRKTNDGRRSNHDDRRLESL